MTWALCFKCGNTKFGAICPCPECGVSSTGDMGLDIAFSDHRMTEESLKQFGDVVRAIRRVCDDDELCFWTFIHYVSTEHSSILGVEMPAERARRCAEILAQAKPPPVQVEESEASKQMRELEARGGPLPQAAPEACSKPNGKPWWKLW